MEEVFYALIGICGLLLALRAVVFAIRLYQTERPRTLPELAGHSEIWKEPHYEAVPPPAQTTYGSVPDDRGTKHSALGACLQSAASTFCRSLRSLTGLYETGLAGKMTVSFSVIIAFFGILTIATVYFTLGSSLERHAGERAMLAAIHIADDVAPLIYKKNSAGLRTLLRRYAGQQGVAYVLVENSAGEILAHSFVGLSEELKRDFVHGSVGQDESRVWSEVGQDAAYEVKVPVLEGRAATVRLGLWRNDFNAEISRTVAPLFKLILLVMCGGIMLTIYFAWKINRPIARLVKAARSISTGNLDAPSLDVDDTSECGELSRAVERLRSSVNAAMSRLNAER